MSLDGAAGILRPEGAEAFHINGGAKGDHTGIHSDFAHPGPGACGGGAAAGVGRGLEDLLACVGEAIDGLANAYMDDLVRGFLQGPAPDFLPGGFLAGGVGDLVGHQIGSLLSLLDHLFRSLVHGGVVLIDRLEGRRFPDLFFFDVHLLDIDGGVIVYGSIQGRLDDIVFFHCKTDRTQKISHGLLPALTGRDLVIDADGDMGGDMLHIGIESGQGKNEGNRTEQDDQKGPAGSALILQYISSPARLHGCLPDQLLSSVCGSASPAFACSAGSA